MNDDSNMLSYAFAVRQAVWVMRGNKPRQGIVYGVLLTPEFGAVGDVIATYIVWFGTSLYGVSEPRCERFRERDLAHTRGELLEKLLREDN